MKLNMKKKSVLWMTYLAGILSALLPASCDTITEELQPCEYYVSFRYDYNMKFADAFPGENSQVENITLFIFDANGVYMGKLENNGPFAEGYLMPFTPGAGTYKLVAWAGLSASLDSYEVPALEEGVSRIEDLTVKLKRAAGGLMGNEANHLFHSLAEEVTFPEGGHHTHEMSLVKDTNKFRIILQMMGQDFPAKLDDVNVSITDENGFLNYDNTLLTDETLTYLPYVESNNYVSNGSNGQIKVLAFELNTLRLMATRHPHLTISYASGGSTVTIADIDLIEYLLLMRMDEYSDMGNQEYLDREDEFPMIFFLAENAKGDYVAVRLEINAWAVRLTQKEDL